MKNIRLWLTYHDDKQIEEYHLKEDEYIKLFKGNDVTVLGENINYLNRFYSEIVTFYYVWKNNLKTDFVGFCHYRRMLPTICEVDKGECLVYHINKNVSVFNQYKLSHNYQDMCDIIDYLNEKYGVANKYSEYILKGNVLVPCCCFIMQWEDYVNLCEWLFPILFAWDKKNGLNMDPEKYIEKARRDFRYEDVNYQCRTVAFLAERLISCYIVTEMKPFSIITV